MTFEQFIDISEVLTPYATVFRYPGDVLEPASSEAEEAIKMAEDVFNFIFEKMPDEVKKPLK